MLDETFPTLAELPDDLSATDCEGDVAFNGLLRTVFVLAPWAVIAAAVRLVF